MGKCLSCFRQTRKNGEPASSALGDYTQTVDHPMGINSSSVVSHNQPAGGGTLSMTGGSDVKQHRTAVEPSDKHSLNNSLQLSTARTYSNDRLSIENNSTTDKHIDEFFCRYSDRETDCIVEDGIERLCADIGVEPEDFSILVLAWNFGAEMMCRFTRTEFINGCHAIGDADSPQMINARLPGLVTDVLNSREKFRDLYRWTYRFGLDEGQRTLPLAMAISLWQLVFSKRPPAVLDRWIAFLEQRPSGSSGIMRDTWDMFLLFTEVIGTDFERYDESEAWPSLIDDFVEFENDRQNHNVDTAGIPSINFCP